MPLFGASQKLEQFGISMERAKALLREAGIENAEEPWDPVDMGVLIVVILSRLDQLERAGVGLNVGPFHAI